MRPSSVMTDPEFVLIDRILAGQQHVYAQLVNRYKSYAFTIALKILENRPEAEEAAQDSFIKAFHHLGNFKRDSRFSTWLYRIVFNTAVSYKRKRRATYQSIENTTIEYGQEAEGMLERSDKKKYIALALSKLNEADKLAITLFYMEEFSLDEIADITGMQANTAKVRIHRARQRLADELTVLLKKEALTL
ncbi:MAG: RNA polymerase sigma factor [Cyclobacteriaceae bacterium]